jgi:hypothetical protein
MASQSRSWVTHQTGNGGWYCLWEKPVPRIEDRIVDCSVYFYHSESAAKEGRGYGGSGFLVHVPSKVAGYVHLYAVTNKHIIDGNCGVLRLNTKTRGVEIINTKLEDWFVHPSGEDVAVRPLQLGETFRWWSVGTDMFITPEAIDAYRIGYGDEAFLVGRLVTHDGRQRNAPAVRFGYVSLMADPSEPIKTKGREQEGFLVDCR